MSEKELKISKEELAILNKFCHFALRNRINENATRTQAMSIVSHVNKKGDFDQVARVTAYLLRKEIASKINEFIQKEVENQKLKKAAKEKFLKSALIFIRELKEEDMISYSIEDIKFLDEKSNIEDTAKKITESLNN
jgi:hypothetical protein